MPTEFKDGAYEPQVVDTPPDAARGADGGVAKPDASTAASLPKQLRHDLLNGVHQIIGYAEMLQEEVAGTAQDGWAADLDRITGAARKLQELVTSTGTAPAREREATAGAPAARLPGPAGTEAGPTGAGTEVGPTSAPARWAPTEAGNPILIVDDDPNNRELLSRRLQREGFPVLVAENGLQAIELMEAHPVDLLLLDVMMPGMNGYQVLERMKADPSLREIPVIMVSGLNEIASVVRCIEMGAADYLTKPFDPVLLRARVGACLEKKQLRDQERRHYKEMKETQDRLAAELADAAQYVRSLLPLPVSGAVGADWRFIPSTNLGGDAFGYHWIDADHFAMYLVDVCGHGVGAALLSVTVMNVLRSQALPGTDFRNPSAVLVSLNNTFQMADQGNKYFTIWYGVYDRSSRRITYSCGGHPPAVLVTGDRGVVHSVTRLGEPGLMVGAFPFATYENASFEVTSRATLFIFSDGMYEVERHDGTMLDFDGFEHVLQRAVASESPGDAIFAEIRLLNASDAFDDDCSLVRIEFL